MAAGIIKVTPVPDTWTQLPDQAVNTIWFERGEYDFAGSVTPGDNYFTVGADDGILSLSVGANGNLNSLWVRTNGSPVTLFWSSP